MRCPLGRREKGTYSVLRVMPTICLALTSMLNCFDPFKSMQMGQPDDAYSRMRSAVMSAGLLLATVYPSVAIVAARAFGSMAGKGDEEHNDGNVLVSMPKENYSITALKLGPVIVITLDYPIQLPPVNMLLRAGAAR